MNTQYMYDNEWTLQYAEGYKQSYEDRSEPQIELIEKGYILPVKECPGMTWGAGGVVDSHKCFVESSAVGKNTYGKAYEFDEKQNIEHDTEMIYAGILPKHWGHFLIDTVSRFWFVLKEEYSHVKIALCYWGWGEYPDIQDSYAEMFDYLGIDRERIVFVNHIISADKIYIPEPVMGYEIPYHRIYRALLDRVVQNALCDERCNHLTKYDKIYFTRTHFFKSRLKEVGEKEIENDFKKAGYQILSPEQLSLTEQIFYINHCQKMAALSGTIPHNVVFAKEGLNLIVLNRTCVMNPPQIRLNQMFQINSIYVDVYSDKTLKSHNDYGVGPIVVEETEMLLEYFRDYEDLDIARKGYVQKLIKAKNEVIYFFLCILDGVKTNHFLKKLYGKIKSKSKQY